MQVYVISQIMGKWAERVLNCASQNKHLKICNIVNTLYPKLSVKSKRTLTTYCEKLFLKRFNNESRRTI